MALYIPTIVSDGRVGASKLIRPGRQKPHFSLLGKSKTYRGPNVELTPSEPEDK